MTARVAAGHRAAEKLFGAEAGEIALGPSSTMLVQNEGDEIVVTDLDHATNIGA